MRWQLAAILTTHMSWLKSFPVLKAALDLADNTLARIEFWFNSYLTCMSGVLSAVKGCYRKHLWHFSPLARSWFHTTAVSHPYQVTPTGFLPTHGGDALTTEQVQWEGEVFHIKTFRQHKPAQEIGKKPQQPTFASLAPLVGAQIWEHSAATTLILLQCPELGLWSFFKPSHQHPFLFWFSCPSLQHGSCSPARAGQWHRQGLCV